MRLQLPLLYLTSLCAIAFSHKTREDLTIRQTSSDSTTVDARELLDDIGFHARALQDAALSARRFEDLEARIAALQDELEIRAEDSDLQRRGHPHVCWICRKVCRTAPELARHKINAHGIYPKKIADALGKRSQNAA
ncbi:hypothetical protein NMY22_g4393 [Coprinellus aureogranulatus]|nr:hypothetical protein NMY22_g4393 [Coprinellus aureogranulatus]